MFRAWAQKVSDENALRLFEHHILRKIYMDLLEMIINGKLNKEDDDWRIKLDL